MGLHGLPLRGRLTPSRAGRRHLEEAVPRVEEGENGQSLHICPSLRGSGRGCQAWTNRRRQVSGSLPASHLLSPQRNFLGGHNCACHSLHARSSTCLRYACTNALHSLPEPALWLMRGLLGPSRPAVPGRSPGLRTGSCTDPHLPSGSWWGRGDRCSGTCPCRGLLFHL